MDGTGRQASALGFFVRMICIPHLTYPQRGDECRGVADTSVAVDQVADTLPTIAATGTEHEAALDQIGRWYAHLLAEDAVGNTTVLHYGPWYVENVDYGAGGASQSGGARLAAPMRSPRSSGWVS